MQTNIQQFVKDNQGSLITFLHNFKRVSKVVVDIQGEYFTGKSQVSDAKIDGFYYFSDCRMLYDHPLVEILEKHNVSVLNLSIGRSCIFKYNHYDDYDSMINGTCLTTSQPVGFHIDSIKEAWAIVMIDSKYTKVYPPVSSKPMDKLASYFEAQNNVKNACEKVNNTLEKLNNSFDKIFKSIDKENSPFTESYPNGVLKCMGTYKNGKLHGNYQEWFDNGKQSIEFEYNEGKIDGNRIVYNRNGDILSYEIVKGDIIVKIEVEEDFHKQYYISPFLRRFLGLKKSEKYPKKDIIKSVFTYCFNLVNPNNKTEIIPDGKLYDLIAGEFGKRITFSELQRKINRHLFSSHQDEREPFFESGIITSGKAYKRHPNGKVKSEAFYKDGKFHGDYYEYFENGRRSKFIQYKNGLKDGIYIEYDITNKIVTQKRFKDDVEVVESPKELKILYRGKAKTVEVVNEYTHENGKEYVIIKDITDNGKTKSLFKEFIEWL